MKRKIYATLIAGALAVSAMGTTVMAANEASGKTDVNYTAGTAGPTDPVKPGEEETSQNNWMVKYPRTVTLTDSNQGTAPTDYASKGEKLQFTVTQKVAGEDGDNTIKNENIPMGIDVTLESASTSWTEEDITLNPKGDAAGTATMKLGSFSDVTVSQDAPAVGNLTDSVATNTAKALLTDTSKVTDGGTYGTTLTFKFAPGK